VSRLAALLTPTRASWVAAALADLDTVLVDHAHCERKAAQTALTLVAKHGGWPALAVPLSRLAREELVHFERVVRELRHRGARLRALPAAGYAQALLAAAKATRPGHAGAATVDELLVCALIEARSHERFVRLGAEIGDRRLAKLYGDLLAAEERHGDLYLELATAAQSAAPATAGADAHATVEARLAELALAEAVALVRPNQPVRMHAGG
jgi:tRNA-(ms[2]io[6]A)-hydroxylase